VTSGPLGTLAYTIPTRGRVLPSSVIEGEVDGQRVSSATDPQARFSSGVHADGNVFSFGFGHRPAAPSQTGRADFSASGFPGVYLYLSGPMYPPVQPLAWVPYPVALPRVLGHYPRQLSTMATPSPCGLSPGR
jgi:hypothetical protein